MSSGFWGEHGLSFYIETGDTNILMDTGQSGDVLLHNAGLMGIDLRKVDSIVLSHGHYDHTGGLMKVLDITGKVKIYAGSHAFEEKLAKKEETYKDIGMPVTRQYLEERCDLEIVDSDVEIARDIVVTGRIERLTEFEKAQENLLVKHGDAVQVDPVYDDRSLVVKSKESPLLLCGCCHSGIINTMMHVNRKHSITPEIIAGGLHMEKADPVRMSGTVGALKSAKVKKVIAGHCTGNALIPALRAAGVNAIELTAGMRIL